MPTGAKDISGCFSDDEETVISYKGCNYYKACDVPVSVTVDGQRTHCVKRLGHQSLGHEDYYGQVSVRGFAPASIDSPDQDGERQNIVGRSWLR